MLSRRHLLQGLAAGAAAAGATRWVRARATGVTAAQAPSPHLVILFLEGGFNALFCSGDSLIDRYFGVTSSNTMQLGSSPVFVDRATVGTLPQLALDHLAVIGCAHGMAAHPTARASHFNDDTGQARHLALADAMDSQAALRSVSVGPRIPYGNNNQVGAVSLQPVPDVAPVMSALAGSDPLGIKRSSAALAIRSARKQSSRDFSAAAGRLEPIAAGHLAAAELLESPLETFDLAGLNAAYGLPAASTSVNGMREQLRAAELMIQAGAGVVTAISGGWDSHGDIDGSEVRSKMSAEIIPALSIFLARTLADQSRNVVTVITGDFSRSIPGSNHQPNLSSMVFGRRCKLGTTGRVGTDVQLPAGTPSLDGHWAYLAAALELPGEPFGPNPHGLIV